MPPAYVVAGLGFGDEGKGTITEFIAKTIGAKIVVRYNGGAQAAHNVVTPDGRHHTFSQFGSGSLVGAGTHLSKHVIIEPLALMNERRALLKVGGNTEISINHDALITTQYHRAANRLREILRKDGRHGSCGMGIGETRHDHLAHPSETPRFYHLKNKGNMRTPLE